MRQHLPAVVPVLALACLAVAPAPRAPAGWPLLQDPASAPAKVLSIDVVVLDRDGRVVDTLGPSDFAVTVDGVPRRVLWVRQVTRGPGAAGEASRRQATRDQAVRFAAEPARSVLVLVDQAALVRGDERVVTQGVNAFLDRLGLDDRVGLVLLPLASDTPIALTTERPEVRDALRRVVGRAQRAAAEAPNALSALQDPDRAGAVDPAKAADPDRTTSADPPVADAAKPLALSPEDRGPAGATPGGLPDLLQALQPVPGRKVVALFSGGLDPAAARQLTDVTVAAAAAHATVYAFGLPRVLDEAGDAPDPAALDRLARMTGGSFVTLGRNADRAVDRVMPELGACYVLGLEPSGSDGDGRRHAVRVETPGRPFALRAPAWLVARPDAEDLVPAVVAPPATAPPPPPANTRDAARRERAAAEAEELRQLLGRATAYVTGYEREYSALVAEEDYYQSARGATRRLRSDLLLVRPTSTEGWVSFRDVYDVDGNQVRDREDRLKRLFLDPSTEARAQLKAIKEESARYNIGAVIRDINVPLFPLTFLETANVSGFEFRLGGNASAAGVPGRRVEFVERARPTLVQFNNVEDLPASGSFLIDPITGAILESTVQLRNTSMVAETAVRYRRDPVLGLWVPGEMRETYDTPSRSSVFAEGRAVYSNFRRFQVKTEEKITIPK